jgi:hypothetical protein
MTKAINSGLFYGKKGPLCCGIYLCCSRMKGDMALQFMVNFVLMVAVMEESSMSVERS